ncbi:hypothetical protein [Massilia sp.]|uniref:hypothetical protein n=1 Tax=Massilia sp. TaxID=1882437 RepID=UPI0028AA6280|nr:hypothetical protein [Massilia sp.]
MNRLTAVFLFCAALLAPAASAQPLSLEELIDASGMTVATLSPDGRHIAAILFDGINHGLILVDTDTLAVKKLRRAPGSRKATGAT